MTITTKKPRFYQEETVYKIAAHKERQHTKNSSSQGIVNWPTGLGKSYFAMLNIHDNYPLDKYRNVFMAPAITLVHQFARNAVRDIPDFAKTYANGMSVHPGVGTVMANINHADARLIVASVPTLIPSDESDEMTQVLKEPIERQDIIVDRFGGIKRNSNSARPYLISERWDQILAYGLPASVTYDEAHHSLADQTIKMFWRLQDLQKLLEIEPIDLIGLTATPVRADGRALISLYDVFYDIRTTTWAQEQGYLVPFAKPPAIRVSIDTGVDEVETKQILNWDEQIYQAITDIAGDRQILCFMDQMPGYGKIDSSRHLARYFSERGFPTAHTDGTLTIDENGHELNVNARQQVYDKFMHRKIRMITAYGVGLEGLDLPIADCVAIFRRTQERHIIIQAIGRALRPHPGKTDCLVIDGVGREIDISPIGTLMGWRVNREGVYEVEDEEELEEDLDAAVWHVPEHAQLIGKNNIYTPAQIKSKSSERWYDDPLTGRWYISINERGDVFCIQTPDFAKLALLRDKLDVLSQVAAHEDNPYQLNQALSDHFERMKLYPESSLTELIATLQYLETYYSSYTLWYLGTKPAGLRQQNYLAYNDDQLALVMESGLILDKIPQVTTAFINKRNQSFKQKATIKQLDFIVSLGGKSRIHEAMDKGEASGIISTLLCNPIMDRLDQSFEKLLLQI